MEATEETQETNENQPLSETPETPKKETDSKNDNVVFIGSKHLMNYVNSIVIQLQNSTEVIIKARGKFISKSVDVAEVAKRQIQEKEIRIKVIQIGTEEYENEGKKVKVSTIEIVLTQ